MVLVEVVQGCWAKKIHECLWWAGRYQGQRRATIAAQMAGVATNGSSAKISEIETHALAQLTGGDLEDFVNLRKMLKGIHHTPESLQQKAIAIKAQALQQLAAKSLIKHMPRWLTKSSAGAELRGADRHLRYEANQLIKHCRSLGR